MSPPPRAFPLAKQAICSLDPQLICGTQDRQRATNDGFQAIYRRHRPMVERTLAWLTRGNRRVPYRGVVKNNAWFHHRVAAVNLRRLLALGLNYNGGWALT